MGFNANYKFEREENKKSEKFKKYVRNRTYRKKKSNKKYDVIQNIKSNVIEFKKVDYALFAVQNMNGIKFESKSIRLQFELEKHPQKQQKMKEDLPQKTEQIVIENRQSMDVDDDINIIKMFGIAQSVKYDQLKDLFASIVGDDHIEHIVYPAPDSLPQSQTAWICVKNDNEGVFGQKLIP